MKLEWLHCARCGSPQHPDAYLCTECMGDDLAPKLIPAQGRIESWTRLHTSMDPLFADLLPWTVVSIKLNAGPTVIAHWAGESPETGAEIELTTIVDPAGREVFAAVPLGAETTKVQQMLFNTGVDIT